MQIERRYSRPGRHMKPDEPEYPMQFKELMSFFDTKVMLKGIMDSPQAFNAWMQHMMYDPYYDTSRVGEAIYKLTGI